MNQDNIGKNISKLRKEKNLTQEELGNILGVSSKTISKWECSNSIPDITIMKKISKEFNISIDELISCSKRDISHKNIIRSYKKILTCLLIIILIIISIIICFFNQIRNQNDTYQQEINNCTVVKTYDIISIKDSNDELYRYITLSEFQTEGIYTVKLSRILIKDLKKDNSYIFTFKTSKDNLEANTDILFNNSNIINIEYTDKIGLERDNYSYCDKINK